MRNGIQKRSLNEEMKNISQNEKVTLCNQRKSIDVAIWIIYFIYGNLDLLTDFVFHLRVRCRRA